MSLKRLAAWWLGDACNLLTGEYDWAGHRMSTTAAALMNAAAATAASESGGAKHRPSRPEQVCLVALVACICFSISALLVRHWWCSACTHHGMRITRRANGMSWQISDTFYLCAAAGRRCRGPKPHPGLHPVPPATGAADRGVGGAASGGAGHRQGGRALRGAIPAAVLQHPGSRGRWVYSCVHSFCMPACH